MGKLKAFGASAIRLPSQGSCFWQNLSVGLYRNFERAWLSLKNMSDQSVAILAISGRAKKPSRVRTTKRKQMLRRRARQRRGLLKQVCNKVDAAYTSKS